MFEKRSPIAKKYATIDLVGREAIDELSVREFAGFNEDLKRNFSSVIEFAPKSQQVVRDRILSRIEELGSECGIEFLLAGRDFPLHSTLLEGESQVALHEKERNELFRSMDDVKDFKHTEEALEGKELEYKYLLIDKGNLLLTAIDIPEEIVRSREELAAFYVGHGLEPKKLENILHISLGRIRELPKEENRAKALSAYKAGMIKLRHSISSDPLKLQISRVSKGETYKFLTRTQA